MTTKNPARYAVTFGLQGCYMPDSHGGAFEVSTRSELADEIRSYIELHDLPKSMIREVKLKRLWGFIKQHGSSTAHFGIYHKGQALEFHGLTEEEYASQRDDF